MIKQKNLLEKLVIIVLIFCVFGAQKTFALKRAISPDPKPLQPTPLGVYPNISGNINSVIEITPDNIPDQNILNEQNNISNETLANTNNQKNFGLYAILGTVILLIILGFKKLKKRVNAELGK